MSVAAVMMCGVPATRRPAARVHADRPRAGSAVVGRARRERYRRSRPTSAATARPPARAAGRLRRVRRRRARRRRPTRFALVRLLAGRARSRCTSRSPRPARRAAGARRDDGRASRTPPSARRAARADEALAGRASRRGDDRGVRRRAGRRSRCSRASRREVAAAAHEDRLRNEPAGLAAALRGLGTGAMEPLWERLGELAMPVDADRRGARREVPRSSPSAWPPRCPRAERWSCPGAGHAAHLEAPGSWPPRWRAGRTPEARIERPAGVPSLRDRRRPPLALRPFCCSPSRPPGARAPGGTAPGATAAGPGAAGADRAPARGPAHVVSYAGATPPVRARAAHPRGRGGRRDPVRPQHRARGRGCARTIARLQAIRAARRAARAAARDDRPGGRARETAERARRPARRRRSGGPAAPRRARARAGHRAQPARRRRQREPRAGARLGPPRLLHARAERRYSATLPTGRRARHGVRRRAARRAAWPPRPSTSRASACRASTRTRWPADRRSRCATLRAHRRGAVRARRSAARIDW